MSKKKRKNKRTDLSLTDNEREINRKKEHAVILAALLLWTAFCVGFYYFSIQARLLWVIHLYMAISIPALSGAILINGYFNAKYAGAEGDDAPDEALIRKVRAWVKALMITGLPPIFCVIVEFVAGRFLEKFL